MKKTFYTNKNSNIFLTGFMGVGKTSTGKSLSKKLERPFFDLDAVVEEYMNKSSFEVIDEYGVDYFRKIETQKLSLVCKQTGAIIALGGGTLISESNQEQVNKSGYLVHLMATEETLFERLNKSHKRPLLKKLEAKILNQLLKEREVGYSQADLCINTDGFTPEDVCEMILSHIQEDGVNR